MRNKEYSIYIDLMKLPFYQAKQGEAMNTAESLYNLGYRKVRGEPPVLSPEVIASIMMNSDEEGWGKGKDVAQSQLEADVRYYENQD